MVWDINGNMTQKLLNKTLRVYMLFSVAVLLVTAPLFYIITQRIQLEEADEALMLRQHEFEKFNLPVLKSSDVSQWNLWHRDIRIENADRSVSGTKFTYEDFPNIMDGDMEPFRVLRLPIRMQKKPYMFFARVNLLDTEDTLYALVLLYTSIILLLLIGLYIITKRYSRKLWRPFHQLLEQLEEFEIARPMDMLYPTTHIEEFMRMNSVVENLLTRNLASYASQREFIENAAHELQTPLAVMRAKLDNLIQLPLSGKEADALETLNHSLDRLANLNRNLLLLSKIENHAFLEKQSISVNEIMTRQLNSLSEQLAFYGVSVDLIKNENNAVQAHDNLLEICLSNLLVNAIRHNTKPGTISISIGNNSVVIANTGPSQSLDKDRLFHRFSKTDPSSPGTGLGLAIVKRITELYHWDIQYSFRDGQHFFLLNFK